MTPAGETINFETTPDYHLGMKPSLSAVVAAVFAPSIVLGWSPAVGPGPDAGVYRQACLEYEAGNFHEKAIGACGLCLESEPGDKQCRALLEKAQAAFQAHAMRAAAIELKLAARLRPPSPPSPPLPSAAETAKEDALRASQQHYLSGVIFFQKGDYKMAREHWELAVNLDPANEDAAAGLAKLKEKGS